MNKTVELVVLWGQYEQAHPKADLAQFCRAYLLEQEQPEKKPSFWQSPVPPDDASILIKLLGRIVKLHHIHSLNAFRECGITSFDEFLYLSSIANTSDPKKTDVILSNFNELSSGLLILDRLKKARLILERADAEDKRTKRLGLTKKGASTLQACYKKLGTINALCFSVLSDKQLKLSIQQLHPVEASLVEKWLADRKK